MRTYQLAPPTRPPALHLESVHRLDIERTLVVPAETREASRTGRRPAPRRNASLFPGARFAGFPASGAQLGGLKAGGLLLLSPLPVAALISALLAGCSSSDDLVEPAGDRVYLTGDVSDGEGPVPALPFAFHDRTTAYPATTATSGTFRVELPLGEYDVRVAPAAPSTGDPQHIRRVAFEVPGEDSLRLSLAAVHLSVLVPFATEGDTVAAGLYANGTPIARQHALVRDGGVEMWFRALLSVPVLVAVRVAGRDSVYFAPGVTEPVPESYLVLASGVTGEMSFALPE